MPDEIITIATYPFPTEANIAKMKLEAEGIESIIENEISSQMVFPPQVLGGVKVLVRAEDAERAIQILGLDAHEESWQITDDVPCENPAG